MPRLSISVPSAPAAPSAPPSSPRTDLRVRGFSAEQIDRLRTAFEALDVDGDGMLTAQDVRSALPDASDAEVRWVLASLVPSSVRGAADKVDLSTFARAFEDKREKAWAGGFAWAFKAIRQEMGNEMNSEMRAERLREALWTRAKVQVSAQEAMAMLDALETEDKFLAAMGVKETLKNEGTKSGPATSRMPAPAASARPTSPLANMFKAIESRRIGDGEDADTKTLPPRTSGKLIFFDGTGDPSVLPAASPSLLETKYPPPKPPPLPSN